MASLKLSFASRQTWRNLICYFQINSFLFNSLSDIVWNDEIFLSQQFLEFIDAGDVNEFVLKLLADHRLKEEPNHPDERSWMHDVKLFQVLFEFTIEVFVGVPEEAEGRLADIFQALVEVRDDIIVLHVLLHGLDDEVDEDDSVEVLSFREATSVDGDDRLAMFVCSNVVDELPFAEVHSYRIFIDVWRLQLLFIVVGIQVREVWRFNRLFGVIRVVEVTGHEALIFEQNLTAVVQLRRYLCKLWVVKLKIRLVIMPVRETGVRIFCFNWKRRTCNDEKGKL